MACNRDLLTALVFWWKVMTTFRHRACVKHRQARRARVIFLRLCFFVCTRASLCSKRFRLVSDQRKTEERDSRFWPREEWNKSQKMKVGGGGGPIPSPLFHSRHFRAVFDSRSSFFAPKPHGNACYAGYTRADKFLHGQILFLDRLFRDGPLEKSACANFCFRSLLVQEFFFRSNPLHDFFYRLILLFFWTVKSHFIISVFVLYKLFYTHNRSKDTGHFLMQNLFENVHTVREEEATWGGLLPCAY